MNSLVKSGMVGALCFVVFSMVWICWLVETFATPHEAVSLDIYRNELFHNPLFWFLGLVSAVVFAVFHHFAQSGPRQRKQTHSTNG